MRHLNYIYKSNDDLAAFLNENSIADSDKLLIRIHSAIHSYQEMVEITSYVKGILPSSHVVGCSTGCIIEKGQIIPAACLISITEFDVASIHTGSLSVLDESGALLPGNILAENILNTISKDMDGSFMLIFFPLTYSRIEAVISTINDSGRKIRMLGGTAYLINESSDNPCYVISDSGALPGKVAFACIKSSKMQVYSDYVCGVESVGKKSPIEAEGTIIKKVDGIQGGDWYSNLLGKKELDKNPSISETFPLVTQDGREIAYHVDYKKSGDEYIIETFPELSTGSRVSVGYFHPEKIFDQVKEVIHNISNHPSQALFAYDCSARNMMLSDCAKWEISNFEETNISGCLLSGEVSCRDGENIYANLSFVMASLADDRDAYINIEEPDVAVVQSLQEENIKSLNFLMANSMKSLNEELSRQQGMLRDAMFYNPAVGIDNQLKFKFDKERSNLNKVAIYYLDNEKMLRLFSGVSETYGYLTDCYAKLTSMEMSRELHFYSYQDTSLLVAADADYSQEKFEKTVDSIMDYLNRQRYGDIKLSYLAVSLHDSKDPLSDLEMALDYVRDNHIKRVRYDEIATNLEREQEKIQVLLAIREAIDNNTVLPYFQEIHSNVEGKPRIFESLMRIKDSKGRIYYPDTFLPVAKEYSLYEKLSETMISNVMDMFRDKNARVTLNLNVQDILSRSMIRMIFDKMKSAPRPRNYVFEILESEEVRDYEYLKNFIDRIHELGGKVAIDDFGSGYSNILNVMRLNTDYIKIDGAVIREIVNDPLVEDFVEFMQGWCTKHHKAMICEYIENKDIQDLMEKYGVAYSQGYYYSKPHPWSEEDE